MKQATRHRGEAASRAPQPPAPRSAERAFAGRVVDGWFDAIDPVAAVRGMSSGFSVLIIGGLLAPLVATQIPATRLVGLTLAAVVGFAVAASKQGVSRAPARQGVTAAVGAYLLVLPLVYLTQQRLDFIQIGLTLLTAIVVGALAGHVVARAGKQGSNA